MKLSFIWLVPVIAAIVAGWLILEHVKKLGPSITIQFADGSGIEPNQTILKYHGVRVGEVHSVQLAKDGEHVEVRARLEQSAAGLARQGSIFWIVRPEVGAGGVHGLETIVSGPYIQAQAGNGREQKKFIGAEEPPILQPDESGLDVMLITPQLHTLSIGAPVYYRGIEVGSVRYFSLSSDSTEVAIHLLIETNYAPLVRTDTKFWNAGGIDVDLKFFGVDISAQTFKSLIIGGIAFATPPEHGPPATNETLFPLYKKPDDKWLEWSSVIAITNASPKAPQNPSSSMLLNSMNPKK